MVSVWREFVQVFEKMGDVSDSYSLAETEINLDELLKKLAEKKEKLEELRKEEKAEANKKVQQRGNIVNCIPKCLNFWQASIPALPKRLSGG